MEADGYEVGYGKPPKNRQFGQAEGNPQRRGVWSIDSTPRFKLEQMMKLSEQQLKEIAENKDAPYFERKLATAIKKGDWKVVREMIEQVYGQPKQTIDTTLVIPEPLAPVRETDLEANQ